jgi:DNA-binding GntR family transcriptional regulator
MRQQGKGTFVKSVVPHLGMTIRTRFAEEPFGSGQRLEREMVLCKVGEQSAEASRYLDGDMAFLHARFCGRIKGEPSCVEDLYVIVRLVPGIETADLIQQSFFEAIQERSLRKIERVVQTIDVVKANPDVAEFLQIKDGALTIVVYRIFVDSDERPIAFTKLIGKVGRYKVQNEFERIR